MAILTFNCASSECEEPCLIYGEENIFDLTENQLCAEERKFYCKKCLHDYGYHNDYEEIEE